MDKRRDDPAVGKGGRINAAPLSHRLPMKKYVNI
jgi:hypothetical protein